MKMTQIAASLSWIHLNSVDLLQAVLWDQADSSCQELVLQLVRRDMFLSLHVGHELRD